VLTENREQISALLPAGLPDEIRPGMGERRALGQGDSWRPDDVWRAITSVSQDEWKAKRTEYHLHRFPAGHNRLWPIAKQICEHYNGDARRIWEGQEPSGVVKSLRELGAGDQISRMIVGALLDCGQVEGPSAVKGDVYVTRVLGRAACGVEIKSEAAVELARRMYPTNPWQLDRPVWEIGESWCHATNPSCPECYLADHCAHSLGSRRSL